MNSNFCRWGMACLIVTPLAMALPVLAQYRWTDPSGQVNYGDAPPSDAKNLARVDGRRTVTQVAHVRGYDSQQDRFIVEPWLPEVATQEGATV